MARTYGMHFIDYFPHRELGIVYYQLGELELAKGELELSINQFPSAKARFYLDRVRKSLIEREMTGITVPKLTLEVQTQEVWTREDPVVISGVAEDEQYVAAITIRGLPIFLEGSQKRIPFSESLSLSQGLHNIQVETRNLMGKTTKRQLVVHVDREGPLVTIDDLQLDQTAAESEVVISGFLYDESGVSGILINKVEIPIRQDVEVAFSKKLTVETDVLELVARDRLGNRTFATIPLAGKKSAFPNPNSAIRNPLLLACADLAAADGLMAGIFGSSDNRPPAIVLKGWTDSQTVYLEKVYLEGQVSDESKIDSLTINNVPILRRKGQSIFFSHLANLQEGENTLVVEARDEAGNLASKKISIVRRIPKALRLVERLSVAVNPFEQKGVLSQASFSFQDNLIDALVGENRFRVVERDKLNLILEEQRLSRSDLIDRSTALRMGRLLAAQSIITGSIIETRAGIEIVARMIDTETSEIIATEDVFNEIKDLPALISLAAGMAIKFHREFPLLDGIIIQSKGKHIFTDLGQGQIKLQRRLIVYREEPITHPVSGKILGADNEILGRAKVTQVLPEMSKAQVIDPAAKTIRRLDKVITE
jgi:hypothetical protein